MSYTVSHFEIRARDPAALAKFYTEVLGFIVSDRGVLAVLFTYVLPLALMTTYPALALLGRLRLGTALGALGGTIVFAAFARTVWSLSIRRYTSASS